MKNLVFVLLLALLGCSSQEEKNELSYRKAEKEAETSEKNEIYFGFGFNSGMTKKDFAKQLQHSRRKGGNTIKVAPYSMLTAEIEPNYASDSLVGIDVVLTGKETILDDNYKSRTKRRYTELLSLLNKKYRKNNYSHEFMNNQAVSWFNGPIEIEASYNESYGIRMKYKDLRYYSKYLSESFEQIQVEEANEKNEQSKEAEKL